MTEHVGPLCSRLINIIALVVAPNLPRGIPTSLRSPGHRESSWTMEARALGRGLLSSRAKQLSLSSHNRWQSRMWTLVRVKVGRWGGVDGIIDDQCEVYIFIQTGVRRRRTPVHVGAVVVGRAKEGICWTRTEA